MTHTLLSDMVKENGFLVIDDIIYTVGREKFFSINYFQSKKKKYQLSPQGRFSSIEKLYIDKILRDNPTITTSNTIKTLERFITDFIQGTQREETRKLQEQKTVFSAIFNGGYFNRQKDNTPIYFPLSKTQSTEKVRIKNKIYHFAQSQNILELDRKYYAALYHAQSTRKQEIEYTYRDLEPYGWYRDQDYYITKRKKTMRYWSEHECKEYIFPECTIGVRLIINAGNIDYDDTYHSGGIRILAAKTMIKGKEGNSLTSLKGNMFVQPATTRTNKNPYPHICISGNNYHFPHTANPKKDIIQVLNDAIARMDEYSDDMRLNSIPYPIFMNKSRYQNNLVLEG